MITLSKLGVSANVFGRFINGILYGYLPGQVLDLEEMKSPRYFPKIAQKLGEWHRIQVPLNKEPSLFQTLNDWLGKVPLRYQDDKTDRLFREKVDVELLQGEINLLQKKLEQLNAPIVFCHCDLLSANILRDEKDSIQFIDYEYACYNYRGFDIGNHFAEYAGLDCDYSRYPSKDFQYQWLKEYLISYDPSQSPSSSHIEELFVEVNQFCLASHLYWGVWALIQARISIIDFDYMTYAINRFHQYLSIKDEVLSLSSEKKGE